MSDPVEKIDGLLDKFSKVSSKVDDFSDLLDAIESTEDKKKMLWKEIYHNAVVDRENAGMLFTSAFKQMQTGTTEHITLGPTLAKYLERMSKSNEQILKLAELITKSEERTSRVDPDDIFSKIKDD
tara:strand:- start:2441 stop:2818 length:378 start_codon:yes stop_codon:yes gene_type:complete